MLRKLMSYEFKASGRILLPTYGAVILMSVISSLFMKLPNDAGSNMNFVKFLSVLFIVLYGMLIAASLALSLIIAVSRYKKNLFDTEGYLMNTLPVKPYQNILSKLLTATVYQIIGFIVAAVSGMIFVLITVGIHRFNSMYVAQFFSMLTQEVFPKMGAMLWVYMIEVTILGIISMFSANLMIYASIAVGHSANSRKVLKSVGAFMGFYIISQIINYNLIALSSGFFDKLNFSLQGSIQIAQPYILALTLLELFYCAAYFVVSNYFLSNRLNLQ